MTLSNPKQMATDLSTQIPPGWSASGLSDPRFDGVNVYRAAQPVSEIRFSTPGPRYVRFTYQLFSPQQAVRGAVTLDGQLLGDFTFPAGQFVSALPGGLVGAGPHLLRFEQRCAAACPVHQYHAKVDLVTAPPPRQSAGLGAVRWRLDSVPSPVLVSGLSATQFDGANLFRSLNDLQAALLTLPKGVAISDLRTFSVSDTGEYRLRWKAVDGPALPLRTERAAAFWPKRQLTEQSLPMVGRSVNQLSVQVECAAGGKACLPVRLYWTELTSLPPSTSLSGLSPLKLAGVGLALLVLLTVFALLLRLVRLGRAER